MKDYLKDLQDIFTKVKDINKKLEYSLFFIKKDLGLVHKLQSLFINTESGIKDYESIRFSEAAEVISGDYSEIINDEKKDWLIFGDVSGHGLISGVIASMVQTAIKTVINIDKKVSPSKLLNHVNKVITEKLDKLHTLRFMSIVAFSFHKRGIVRYSGLHNGVMWYKSKEDTVEDIETKDVLLGLPSNVTDTKYSDYKIKLKKDDLLLFYTDGLNEANRGDEMFGHQRIREILMRYNEMHLFDLQHIILSEVSSWEKDDDLSFIILRKKKGD